MYFICTWSAAWKWWGGPGREAAAAANSVESTKVVRHRERECKSEAYRPYTTRPVFPFATLCVRERRGVVCTSVTLTDDSALVSPHTSSDGLRCTHSFQGIIIIHTEINIVVVRPGGYVVPLHPPRMSQCFFISPARKKSPHSADGWNESYNTTHICIVGLAVKGTFFRYREAPVRSWRKKKEKRLGVWTQKRKVKEKRFPSCTTFATRVDFHANCVCFHGDDVQCQLVRRNLASLGLKVSANRNFSVSKCLCALCGEKRENRIRKKEGKVGKNKRRRKSCSVENFAVLVKVAKSSRRRKNGERSGWCWCICQQQK